MLNRSRIMALLTKVLYIGIDRAATDDAKRGVLLTNVMTCVAIFFTTVYQVHHLFYQWHGLLIFNFLMTCLYLSIFLMTKAGHGRFAIVFYFIVLIFQLTINPRVFLGADCGIHFFLMAVPPMVFLMMPERHAALKALLIALPAIAFSFVEYVPFQSPADVHAPALNLKIMRIFGTTGTMAALTLAIYVFFLDLKATKEALAAEHARSESLLLNILPGPIAERLKRSQEKIADAFPGTSILFADIVGFTQLSSRMLPNEVASLLNCYFSAYDDLTERYHVEKIKTIGDGYMAAAGIPTVSLDHADLIMKTAIDMLEVTRRISRDLGLNLTIRIGINSGPSAAGIVGKKKFVYDLWGDTVNVAARMESHGEPGRIQVSEATYQLLKEKYAFEFRGKIAIKGKGELPAYLLKA